jgi:hypothetical protein
MKERHMAMAMGYRGVGVEGLIASLYAKMGSDLAGTHLYIAPELFTGREASVQRQPGRVSQMVSHSHTVWVRRPDGRIHSSVVN